MIETKLSTPQGDFVITRYPAQKKQSLRAWDAADEYLLAHIKEELSLKSTDNILIVNDNFGALSVALAEFSPIVMSDSYIALQSITKNLHDNKINAQQVTLINSLQPLEDTCDYIFIRIPKSLAQLEDQLHRLRPVITETTVIIASGMSKSIHTSTLNLFEKVIGITKTSLARKKARLIFSQVDPGICNLNNPYPNHYKLENTDFTISNHASVFSQDHLDIGTRFFIEHIPSSGDHVKIVDLGCGNGVVGVVAAARNLKAEIIFTDESYMAVESARINFKTAFGKERHAQYMVSDCMEGIDDNSIDIVLCNPPFHQHNAIGDSIAWRMFTDAKRVLRQGGELRVIGNRHLAYHEKLKRLFANYVNIASNKKFAIVKAVKR